ncbi:hypothetical protein TRFO_29540 [Tritrichomonas foetus]|uniref:DUF3447 domain-containing protein n=1 Tax=Tritrichomonas foetus TaxID=1144522 RepID=A0A1J4K0Q9_9EUKA|nr:hypothetical protein TRFO_29540 [Tritrichomonas foetus]|eukprot:OHT03085.1 hypothetical protein TRFO_29540 [Tritrichomonas foetus]
MLIRSYLNRFTYFWLTAPQILALSNFIIIQTFRKSAKMNNSHEKPFSPWMDIIDAIIGLQDILINSPDDVSDEEIGAKISPVFFSSPNYILTFFNVVSLIFSTRIDKFDQCIKLAVSFSPFLKRMNLPHEVCFYHTNGFIYYNLYLHGFLNFDYILKLAPDNQSISEIFYPEINEKYPDFFKTKKSESEINEIKKFREIGKNHHPIASAIQNDDIDTFQEIIAKQNIKLDSQIPYSVFESHGIVNRPNDMPTLIEFAAFFGATKIFKYLILNNFSNMNIQSNNQSNLNNQNDIIDNLNGDNNHNNQNDLTNTIFSRILRFAVAGGNYEIIHLLEGYKIDMKEGFRSAIMCHRNELVEYFMENFGFEFSPDEIFLSIEELNMSLVKKNLDNIYKNPYMKDSHNNNIIHAAVKSDLVWINEMIFSLPNMESLLTEENSFHITPMMQAVAGSHQIFKYLVSTKIGNDYWLNWKFQYILGSSATEENLKYAIEKAPDILNSQTFIYGAMDNPTNMKFIQSCRK